MFVNERGRHDTQRKIINNPGPGSEAEPHQPGKRRGMQPERERHRPAHAEPEHHRMQALALIHLVILRGVDEVEARHPDQHRCRKNERRETQRSGHRDPRAHRGCGERQPEKEMRERREPLGERIEKHDRQRERREQEAQRV